MEQREDAPLIFLKDLFFSALHQWRKILLWALTCALLLGAVKAFRSLSELQNDELQSDRLQQYEIEWEAYESRKDSIQQQIDVTRENARQQQIYLERSVLMNLDPYDFYRVYFSFYLDTGYQIQPGMDYQTPDKTGVLLSSYEEFFISREFTNMLADILKADPHYISELLSVSCSVPTCSLVIKFATPDESTAQKVLNLLTSQLDSLQDSISDAISDHTLYIKKSYSYADVDIAVARQQQEEITALTSLNNTLLSLQTEKNTLKAPQIVVTSIGSIVKDIAFFAVLGAFIGMFFFVVIVWFRHIAGSTVFSAKMLKNLSGLPVLSCINTGRFSNRIDCWLRRLEGRSFAPAEQQAALLALHIRALHPGADSLLITGTVDGPEYQLLADAFRKAMPQMQVYNTTNLLEDVSTLETLDRSDLVLLVEQCNISRTGAVEQQLSIIRAQKKTILGFVLLDG